MNKLTSKADNELFNIITCTWAPMLQHKANLGVWQDRAKCIKGDRGAGRLSDGVKSAKMPCIALVTGTLQEFPRRLGQALEHIKKAGSAEAFANLHELLTSEDARRSKYEAIKVQVLGIAETEEAMSLFKAFTEFDTCRSWWSKSVLAVRAAVKQHKDCHSEVATAADDVEQRMMTLKSSGDSDLKKYGELLGNLTARQAILRDPEENETQEGVCKVLVARLPNKKYLIVEQELLLHCQRLAGVKTPEKASGSSEASEAASASASG